MKLSSYELLIYLDDLDEEGAFKTAYERGGRWPGWKQMLAENTNELYRIHASYNLVNGGEDASFDPADFESIDPVDQVRRAEAEAVKAIEQSASQSSFESETGYS